MVSPRFVFVVAALATSGMLAVEIQGADAVLKRLAEAAERPPGQVETADPVEEWRTKVIAFEKESDSLPPAEAATRWLILFDAYAAIPEGAAPPESSPFPLAMETLILALPAPEAWEALAAAIEKRTEEGQELRGGGLKLLAAVLRGDPKASRGSVASLRKAVERDSGWRENERTSLVDALDRIDQVLDARSGSGNDETAAFAKELSGREERDAHRRQRSADYIEIPDLVRAVGKEAAAPLIERAVRLGGNIGVTGAGTRKLTAQLALRNMDFLETPPWALIRDLDDAPLYEALVKKFPNWQQPKNEWVRGEADGVYLLSLIAANRTDEAAAFLTSSCGRVNGWQGFSFAQAIKRMQRAGLDRRVVAFLHDSLDRDPTLPFWDAFLSLSTGKIEKGAALELQRETMGRPNLSKEVRLRVGQRYSAALLAANEVDEGVRVLRELVSNGRASGQGAGKAVVEEAGRHLTESGVVSRCLEADLALQLASLGRLLTRPELIDEGVAAAEAADAKMVPEEEYPVERIVTGIVNHLLANHRGGEAEEFLTKRLLQLVGAQRRGRADSSARLLGQLASVYDREDRPGEVVRLLEHAPPWPAADLAQLATDASQHTPLLIIAGRALAATGRKDEARKIARRAVQECPEIDAGYALLLQTGGDEMESYLDHIFQFDRFEARPLIWKAKLQFDAGRIAEAEKTVRAAIAIDPSDGVAGKGNRMRAYAVLGDILERKGDAAQAMVMRGAVTAISLSEEADDWWDAGIRSRAMTLYEEALKSFPDSYFLQSVLAWRYGDLGDFSKAEHCYQRAFELMSEGTGRWASDCSVCSSLSDSRAQGIAERIFGGLVERRSERPQVYYLLGYLRGEQGRVSEAVALYRKAVALDPDYLNAWRMLQEAEDAASLPPTEREEIGLAILRLDPTCRHIQPKLEDVTDLRKLWTLVRAADRLLQSCAVGPVLPLAVSRSDLERPSNSDRGDGDALSQMPGQSRGDSRDDLRRRFCQHGLIEPVVRFLDQITRRR